MVKKLTKTGNSLALVLDKPILEATGIELETPLEISTDGDVIVITPVRSEERTDKLRTGMREIHERYGDVFRRLAE
ncbi:MAG: AbrB/MazE/SpoVT family DNA-binding domain-containing protein [Acidobacteriota bacterium]